MKIKLLDEIPYINGLYTKSIIEEDKRIEFTIKKSKSFVIIRNNLIEYVEKHDMLRKNDQPLILNPFASFKILKLTKDTYKGHRYTPYKIKIDFVGLNQHWYFVDLNCWKYFRIQFNADKSWINKSNIYRLIYLVIGAILGVIGTIVAQLFTTWISE